MIVSKNLKPRTLLTIGVIIWGALIVFLLYDLATDRLVVFDESQSIMAEFVTVEQYLDEVTSAFGLEENDRLKVLRVTDSHCACNFASSLHWEQLQNQYVHVDYIEIDIQALDAQLLRLVPSTPMAIVANAQGTVLYAGPFSDANYCNAENSLIEAYLKESLKQRYSPLETQGCYCKATLNE